MRRGMTTAEVEAYYAANPGARVPGNRPLTTGQHILHLLITVFTAGLWAPAWFYLAMRGNRAPR